jgi:hypothetical protein
MSIKRSTYIISLTIIVIIIVSVACIYIASNTQKRKLAERQHTMANTAGSKSQQPVPVKIVDHFSIGKVEWVFAAPSITLPGGIATKFEDQTLTAPPKWLECNGQKIDVLSYPELVAIVGEHAPDFRGRSVKNRAVRFFIRALE